MAEQPCIREHRRRPKRVAEWALARPFEQRVGEEKDPPSGPHPAVEYDKVLRRLRGRLRQQEQSLLREIFRAWVVLIGTTSNCAWDRGGQRGRAIILQARNPRRGSIGKPLSKSSFRRGSGAYYDAKNPDEQDSARRGHAATSTIKRWQRARPTALESFLLGLRCCCWLRMRPGPRQARPGARLAHSPRPAVRHCSPHHDSTC